MLQDSLRLFQTILEGFAPPFLLICWSDKHIVWLLERRSHTDKTRDRAIYQVANQLETQEIESRRHPRSQVLHLDPQNINRSIFNLDSLYLIQERAIYKNCQNYANCVILSSLECCRIYVRHYFDSNLGIYALTLFIKNGEHCFYESVSAQFTQQSLEIISDLGTGVRESEDYNSRMTKYLTNIALSEFEHCQIHVCV